MARKPSLLKGNPFESAEVKGSVLANILRNQIHISIPTTGIVFEYCSDLVEQGEWGSKVDVLKMY